MRIVFIDTIAWDYVVDSAYREPLGGSQSAVCYLAEALVGLGHDVCLLNNIKEAVLSRGVQCLPLRATPLNDLVKFDVAILVGEPGDCAVFRNWLRPGARFVLWTGYAHDQPAVQTLLDPCVAAQFDAFAFVSQWQRQQFEEVLGIRQSRSRVLHNAIAPAFADRFADGPGILAAKRRPVLAYTSTPFRGLDLLLAMFPAIRAQVPDAVLRVYSNMRVYHVNQQEDNARFGHLYQLCRQTPGVEHVGTLPQPVLAEQLRDVMVLAYPNHYAETSCIAVMEAMAVGCRIVTSDLGALADTTAGFARLIPVGNDWNVYGQRFIAETVAALRAGCVGAPELGEHLARQIAYVHQNYTWPGRAVEWSGWLRELMAGTVTRN